MSRWIYSPLPFLTVLIICNFVLKQHPVAAKDEWIPVDWTTLPEASADDTVQVYYLVAPLLEEDTGELFAKFGLYHGGLGFTNVNTNFSITINYDADDIFRAALFPEIVTYPNGTKDLEWLNQGGSFIYLGINTQYWESGRYLVSTISGSLYNEFMSDFNAKINASQPFYNMFSIASGWGGKVYYQSWDCFDYVWDAMNYLYDNGALYSTEYNNTICRDYSNLYTSTAPINVTYLYYNDPTIHKEIVDMYELIQLSFRSMDIFELLETIIEVFEGKFYVRESNDYWQITLKFPFIGLDWYPTPLPGQGEPPMERPSDPLGPSNNNINNIRVTQA